MGSELRRARSCRAGDSARRCRRSALPIDVMKATRAAMLAAAPINQPSARIIVSFNSSQPRKTNGAPGNTQRPSPDASAAIPRPAIMTAASAIVRSASSVP